MIFCKLFRMAEDGSPSKRHNKNGSESSSDSEQHLQPQPIPLSLDLGDDLSHNIMDPNRLENANVGVSGSTVNEVPKREDNPFSFKHFLRSDTNSYQNKGARPKIYCDSRHNASPVFDKNTVIAEPKSSRKIPELSSALPDFVQDHLVIEQCYLGNSPGANYNIDANNLPDFTPDRNGSRSNFESSQTLDREPCGGNNLPIPLDLPGPPPGGFPFDLPTCGNSRGGPPLSESLPDFLADSAVCSQLADGISGTNSPDGDSERVRRELDVIRRQLIDQTRLCESLRRELDIAKNKEREYTQNLGRALEKVEDNLEKSNKRAASAENTVLKLRQENKTLMAEINRLKMENESLKGEEAAGGHSYYSSSSELHSYHLARELRAAASTAEHSLRQLLTGVDNLRIMAASLENMHRIEEKNDPFSKFDEDAGPAL